MARTVTVLPAAAPRAVPVSAFQVPKHSDHFRVITTNSDLQNEPPTTILEAKGGSFSCPVFTLAVTIL